MTAFSAVQLSPVRGGSPWQRFGPLPIRRSCTMLLPCTEGEGRKPAHFTRHLFPRGECAPSARIDMIELSSEDSFRLNVLLANKPLAIRIDESRLAKGLLASRTLRRKLS